MEGKRELLGRGLQQRRRSWGKEKKEMHSKKSRNTYERELEGR